jgi:23S rRNA (uracil1939-C5)-methyltransferase
LKPEAAPEIAVIESLDHEGRGVAHVGGKAVFVDGALPGETVRFRRTRRQRRYDEAVAEGVERASPLRVEPRCRHFGLCGGCSLQHLDHAAQLEAKGRVVADALERIGGVAPAAWLEPLTGPAWNYRRRARLGCKYVDKKGRQLVGFRERGSPLLADLAACEVLAEPVGGLVAALAEMIGGLEIRRRVAQVEVAVADNVTALVLRVLDDPAASDLDRLRAFESHHGVALYLQRGGLETVAPLTPPAEPLRYALDGLPAGIEFAPTDFVQVNGPLNRLMVARALELLDPRPGDRALDIYCGLGNFSRPLALRVASVDGV